MPDTPDDPAGPAPDPDPVPDPAVEALVAELSAGLEGAERRARRRLVVELLERGTPPAEVRRAARQGRLVLLPLERALHRAPARHSLLEVAADTGLDLDLLERMRVTLGLPTVDPGARELTDDDVDAVRTAAQAVAAGLSADDVLEINGVLSGGMSDLAVTLRRIAQSALVRAEAGEAEVADTLAFAVEEVMPLIVPVLEYALRAQLVQQVTDDFVEAHVLREGRLGQARPTSVAFADVVGFTQFAETTDARVVGLLNQRLIDLCREVTRGGRCRLVKTIGDAVMLVAPTPDELATAVLALLEAADAVHLPPLRAAMAHGDVLVRGGDVFGRPVNRASRLTATAPLGALVCDRDAAAAVTGHDLEELDAVELAGITGPVPRWLVRGPR